MVFEVQQGDNWCVLPYSEFSCFHGTLNPRKVGSVVCNGPLPLPTQSPVAGQNSQQVATVVAAISGK